MSWIESHQSMLRHRKTTRAAQLLRMDRYKFIGHMHALWWWGLDNAGPEGQLPGVTADEITEAAGIKVTQTTAFVGALEDVGFLEITENGYVLHDWWDYAGKLAQKREADREKNRRNQQAWRDRNRLRNPVTSPITNEERNSLRKPPTYLPTYPTTPSGVVERANDGLATLTGLVEIETAGDADYAKQLADEYPVEVINAAITAARRKRKSGKLWLSQVAAELPDKDTSKANARPGPPPPEYHDAAPA